MKVLITFICLLVAAPVFGWEFQEVKNEMGDVHFYMAETPSLEKNAAFSIMNVDGNLVIGFLSNRNNVDSQKLDIRVDKNEMVSLPTVTEQGLIMSPIIPDGLIDQIKAGDLMLVRFYTRDDSHVVKFDLEGAEDAINKLMEARNGHTE